MARSSDALLGGCFLEHQLVKPLASLLVVALLGTVAWVAAGHMAYVKTRATGPGVSRPFLGLRIVDPDALVARMFSVPLGEAVLVDLVLQDSPAEQAGLRRGDGIIAINGESVRTTEDVATYLDRVRHGDLLKLTVVRGGLIHYFLLPAAQRPFG